MYQELKTNYLKGTGCGLVSITLSILKCKKVYATDLENILEIADKNIKQNFVDQENLILRRLEW